MSATDWAGSRPATAPPFLTERNIGPAVMLPAASHAFSAATGQATLPRDRDGLAGSLLPSQASWYR